MWNSDNIKRIDIELTSFCNIKCSACSRQDKNVQGILNDKILSVETIRQKFRREDFPSLESVNFCGSIDEPIMHPDIMEVIEFFKEWNVALSISTNGSLRTPDWWQKLAETLSGTKHTVVWGVDGIDETSEIYRYGSSFVKVRENWRAFNSAGGYSIWQFIVFAHNEHQLPLLDDIAKQEGFKTTKIIYSSRKPTVNKIKIVGKPVDAKIIPVVTEPKTELDAISCKYLTKDMIFINHLGDVIPCCYMNPAHLYDELSIPPNFLGLEKYIQLWKSYGGELATNLQHNEIKDVVNGNFFKAIVNTWETDPIVICSTKCKVDNFNKSVKRKLT